MTALYRSARRVDALRTFTTVRNRLIEDIGVEPGPRLAELQASILAADPALADNVLGESRPGLNLGVTSEPSVMPRGGRDHGAERDGRDRQDWRCTGLGLRRLTHAEQAVL